jgi:spore germination cell wall hydrolase CwlJ-like protein
MSTKLRYASAISIAAMMMTVLFGTGGSGAIAQSRQPAAAPQAAPRGAAATASTNADETLVSQATSDVPDQVIIEGRAQDLVRSAKDDAPAPDAAPAAQRAPTLAALVEQTDAPADSGAELACLAGAIYFEAKGESLAGQLAVGRVIVARANSGRFPDSYCGVVYQPSQFSFVHGHAMPGINHASRAWAIATRVARIADEGSWHSPAEGALFFHAAHVTPGWNRTRIAQVDHQVFYR